MQKATDKNYEPKGNSLDPLYVREIGNMTLRQFQLWINSTKVYQVVWANVLRQGVEIYNNGSVKCYVGHTSDITVLKQVGRPIQPNTGFSSSSYQGDLYVVFDDATGTVDQDVRIWDEQL